MLNYQHATSPGVQVTTAQGLNVLDITNADSLVITEAAAKKLRRLSDTEARDILSSVITEEIF